MAYVVCLVMFWSVVTLSSIWGMHMCFVNWEISLLIIRNISFVSMMLYENVSHHFLHMMLLPLPLRKCTKYITITWFTLVKNISTKPQQITTKGKQNLLFAIIGLDNSLCLSQLLVNWLALSACLLQINPIGLNWDSNTNILYKMRSNPWSVTSNCVRSTPFPIQRTCQWWENAKQKNQRSVLMRLTGYLHDVNSDVDITVTS